MKTKTIFIIVMLILLVSCTKEEVKVSESDLLSCDDFCDNNNYNYYLCIELDNPEDCINTRVPRYEGIYIGDGGNEYCQRRGNENFICCCYNYREVKK